MASEETKKKVAEILKNCIFTADTVMSKERETISVSPVIDDLLGGGIQSGSLTLIVGPDKTGKTSTCLHIAKKVQEHGFKIVYLNIEARLSNRDIHSAVGLDYEDESKLRIVESTKEYLLSGEDFVAVADHILSTEEKTLVIFDSFSQLISAENLHGDIRDRTRDYMPLILSKFCKRALPNLMVRNNMVVGINHVVSNTGPGMSTKSETSGKKLQYANNFKLNATWKTPWASTDGKTVYGQQIHWKCENSALGPPGRQGIGFLRYNHGLDEEAELAALGLNLSIISKSGSWLSFGETRVQGINKLIDYLKENPEATENLRESVRFSLVS